MGSLKEIIDVDRLSEHDVTLLMARIARGDVLRGMLPRDMKKEDDYVSEFEAQARRRTEETGTRRTLRY